MSNPKAEKICVGYTAKPRWSTTLRRWRWDIVAPSGDNIGSVNRYDDAHDVAARHAKGPQ